MTYYDYQKAIDIIEDHRDEAVEVTLGMDSDWSWTAEPVWKNGEWLDDYFGDSNNLYNKPVLAGIRGSYWDRPVMEIEFKDGRFKRFPIGTKDHPDDQTIKQKMR